MANPEFDGSFDSDAPPVSDELPVDQDSEEQDEDAPIARDDSYFARQLGDEWQVEEPGIYRYVGPADDG